MHNHLITSDPGGRPVIAGTHVSVEEVLKELAAWQSVDDVLTAHPELDRNAVQAVLAYAAALVHVTANDSPVRPSAEEESFMPQTEYGKELLELRKKAVEEARAHDEPLLDMEGIRREVRNRRGERDVGTER